MGASRPNADKITDASANGLSYVFTIISTDGTSDGLADRVTDGLADIVTDELAHGFPDGITDASVEPLSMCRRYVKQRTYRRSH